MDPDNFLKAWQAQSSQARVTINSDLLLNELQREQQALRAIISLGDLAEIGTSLLMLPVMIYKGITMASPWTWYLMVPVYLWSIGFSLVVRARQKRKLSDPGEPLLKSVKESLALVEHQIWWTRTDFWLSQLPMAMAMLAFFAHLAWLDTRNWRETLGPHLGPMLMVVVFYGALYFLNRRVLRTQYEPRRQELLTLLASLRDETTSEVSAELSVLMSANRIKCPPRPFFLVSLCLLTVIFIAIASIILVFRHTSAPGHVYPEKSPFAAVRWQESHPVVRVGDEWFKLVSLDDVPADEIVAFSRKTYANRWQKRFEEDLVELLSRKEHPPQDTVKLVVQSLTSSETRVLDDIPMTAANRWAIKADAQARANNEP